MYFLSAFLCLFVASIVSASNLTAWEQIHHTLSTYPLAIDSKNFGLLSQVYTPNAVANYSTGTGVLNGLPNIETTLQTLLAPVITQHLLGTTKIDIAANGSMANSTTYYQASQFGTGDFTGEVYYSYGQYQDVLISTAAGWRINMRTLVYMGPGIGNISVFGPTS